MTNVTLRQFESEDLGLVLELWERESASCGIAELDRRATDLAEGERRIDAFLSGRRPQEAAVDGDAIWST